MKKLLVYTAFTITAFWAGISYAAEIGSSKAVPASPTAPETIEMPKGIITHRSVADAPLPSDFVLGNKDAPVVMIEYASLSCPHCAAFYVSIMPDLQKNYIDTGKVRYVLRQFPLNEPAFRGAMLVDCLGAKYGAEKYYLFNKVLFDSQSKWAFDGNWQSGLEKISAIGGVGKDEFTACITDKTLEEKSLKGKKEALDELKVPHTPYFFIGGEAYNNDLTLPDLSKFIDSKLPKK